MIGIFDSGAGGLRALSYLRETCAESDICFFADLKNAPYGTKTQEEITKIVRTNIRKLKSFGAEKILIACCTASTVYKMLEKGEQEISIPIITPSAKSAAEKSRNGKIAVIATEATVRSHSFKHEIQKINPSAKVREFALQKLVTLIENGLNDTTITKTSKAEIKGLLSDVDIAGCDTLVLGCTHFPHLKNTISDIFPKITIIDTAYEGAAEAAKYCKKESCATVYL